MSIYVLIVLFYVAMCPLYGTSHMIGYEKRMRGYAIRQRTAFYKKTLRERKNLKKEKQPCAMDATL